MKIAVKYKVEIERQPSLAVEGFRGRRRNPGRRPQEFLRWNSSARNSKYFCSIVVRTRGGFRVSKETLSPLSFANSDVSLTLASRECATIEQSDRNSVDNFKTYGRGTACIKLVRTFILH